jgi:hypothetical protein
MNDDQRLERLHLLLNRLERLPASPDRERMLYEVRVRAVDVETGVPPRPMRPSDADATTSAPEHVRSRPAKVKRMPPPTVSERTSRPPEVCREAPVPPTEDTLDRAPLAEHRDAVDLLAAGGLLWLEELPGEASPAPRPTPSPPWARGLRG